MGWGVANTLHHQDDIDSGLRALGSSWEVGSAQAGEPEIHHGGVEFPSPQQRQSGDGGIHHADLARAIAQDASALLLRRRIEIDEQHFSGHGGDMKADDGQGLHPMRERA
jgi:hypothetical protein